MSRLFLLAICLSTAAWGQGTLEIIPLRHRTADQVIPSLRPLLEPGATLTGHGTQLIVRTSPGNLAELQQALGAIDRPARRLQISVRLEESREGASGEVGASGRISERGSRIDIRADERETRASGRADQHIQVLEGGRATIFTGVQTPYRDLASGFYAVPRLVGDRVLVDILQQEESPVRQQRLATTVSARLGEWFEVGGAVEGAAREDRGLASRSTAERTQSRRVWLKVEALP